MQNKTSLEKVTFSVAVMSFSVILAKVCGMLFKIPLTSILGTYGMGLFNTAYTVYSLLFVLCSAGLPSAIAISVSSSDISDGLYKSRILSISLRFFGIISLACSLATYALADTLAKLLNNPESAQSLKALSACVFFTTVCGVFKGYFQGHNDMVPTAVSQIMEAFGKLLFGVLFAFYAFKKGYPIGSVAAYAVFGVTISSILSAAYLLLKYVVFKNKVSNNPNTTVYDNKTILKKLLKTAAPITLSSLVMSVVGIIDLVLVMRLLNDPSGAADYRTDQYGAYSALATPIFNLPSVLILPIATVCLPIIAGAVGTKSFKKAYNAILYAVKLCVSIAVPSALGLCFLSRPILLVLFEDTAAIKAAPMLSALSGAVVFMCLVCIQNPILQASQVPVLPMISMLIGALVKVIVGVFMISKMGIYACALGTLACYCISSLINGYFIERRIGVLIPYLRYFLHSLVCAIPATALSYMLYRSTQTILGNTVACFASIALCVILYTILVLASGFFKIKDIACLLCTKRKALK